MSRSTAARRSTAWLATTASLGLHVMLGLAVLIERIHPEGLVAPPAIEASLIDFPLPSLAAATDHAVAAPRSPPQTDPLRPRPRPLKRPPPPEALTFASPAPTETITAPALFQPSIQASAPSASGRAAGPPGITAPGGAAVRERGAAAQARDPYAAQVLAWLEGRKHMPDSLRRRRARGVVVVAFTLDRWGRLSRPAVIESSGDHAVDAAALDLLASAAPFPRAPREAEWSRRHFEMPIDYAALETG